MPDSPHITINPHEARMLVNALRWGDPALADLPAADLEALKGRLRGLAVLDEEQGGSR